MVKHLYFAFHICEIKLLLFLHLYTSAGGFCDHLLDSSNLVIWHKKMHDHLVCVLRVKDRKLILCCNAPGASEAFFDKLAQVEELVRRREGLK